MHLKIVKNPNPAPRNTGNFGQDVEPHGNYVNKYSGFIPNGSLKGEVVFENPYIVNIDDNDIFKWKYELSEKFKAKGKNLTNKMMESGYDGVVTIYDDGYHGEIILFPNAKFFLNEI